LRKGSKEAKAWGAKMRRLRGKPKTKRRKTRKTTTRRRRTTRKGQRRKTVSKRRAYEGLTVRVRKRGAKRRQTRTESAWTF